MKILMLLVEADEGLGDLAVLLMVVASLETNSCRGDIGLLQKRIEISFVGLW